MRCAHHAASALVCRLSTLRPSKLDRMRAQLAGQGGERVSG